MFRQRMEPAVFSIREIDEGTASEVPAELRERICYFPQEEQLTSDVRALRAEHKIPSRIWEVFSTWGDRGDKTRLYEAAWLGSTLKRRGIRHVHVHFAGIGARAAYWMKKFWGIGYSFTGHANDIFCETDFPVSLADLVREARFVATETDYSRDWLRAKFPHQARRIVRCYNGIDTERFAPGGEVKREPRIISVGRYIEKKGFPYLIEACRLLRDRGVVFECDIVGTGPLEAELRTQISSANLESQVRITGPRGEEEVLAMLHRSAVFALPCVYEAAGGSDNLPTVIMEGMSCALPVVSTRVAGIPEMVRDGETGFLVGEKSPGETADALGQLLSDPSLAQECGRRGRALVLSKFSTAATTRRLKHLLVARAPVGLNAAAISHDPALAFERVKRVFGLGSILAK